MEQGVRKEAHTSTATLRSIPPSNLQTRTRFGCQPVRRPSVLMERVCALDSAAAVLAVVVGRVPRSLCKYFACALISERRAMSCARFEARRCARRQLSRGTRAP